MLSIWTLSSAGDWFTHLQIEHFKLSQSIDLLENLLFHFQSFEATPNYYFRIVKEIICNYADLLVLSGKCQI
jgi:hypothetical protein